MYKIYYLNFLFTKISLNTTLLVVTYYIYKLSSVHFEVNAAQHHLIIVMADVYVFIVYKHVIQSYE